MEPRAERQITDLFAEFVGDPSDVNVDKLDNLSRQLENNLNSRERASFTVLRGVARQYAKPIPMVSRNELQDQLANLLALGKIE